MEKKGRSEKKKKIQLKELQVGSKESAVSFLEGIFTRLSQNVKDNLSNIRVNRFQIRNYLLQRYSDRVIDRFLNFFEIQNSYDFSAFQTLRVHMQQLYFIQAHRSN